MRKTLLFTGVLLALTASMALADGVELAWNACRGYTGVSPGGNPAGLPATSTRTSTCTSTSTVALAGTLWPSFVVSGIVNGIIAADEQIDYQIPAGLQCYWDFVASPTRLGITVTNPPATDPTDGSPSGCGDFYFLGRNPQGGGAALNKNSTSATIKSTVAIAAAVADPSANGLQEMTVRIAIVNAAPGTCAGCISPGCFVLNGILISQVPGDPDIFLTNEVSAGSSFVTWQGGGGNCPGATPTKKATWGSIKALYR